MILNLFQHLFIFFMHMKFFQEVNMILFSFSSWRIIIIMLLNIQYKKYFV